MTKVCTCCGREKAGNDSQLILTFDQNLSLRLPKTFFTQPHHLGNTNMVKSVHIIGQTDLRIRAAVKWSRKQHLCDPLIHFVASLGACDHTAKVVTAFIDIVHIKWKFKIVKPILLKASEMIVSVEPYVNDVQQFVCDDGDDATLREVCDVLNALSHYSYIFSKKRYLITGFKGRIDEPADTITLLAPSMLSNTEGQYGCDDLGSVKKYFFSSHVCNPLCEGMKRPNIRCSSEGCNNEDIVFTHMNLDEEDLDS